MSPELVYGIPLDAPVSSKTGRQRGGPRGKIMESQKSLSLRFLVISYLFHIGVTFLARQEPVVATLWALGTLLVGFVVVLQPRSWEKTAAVASYITGAELIWRGSGAWIFWEFGKYSLILLLGLSLLKNLRQCQLSWKVLVYGICLIPSLMVLPSFDRSSVAFNLSGPGALVITALFFYNRELSRTGLLRLATVCLGPIVGLAAISTYGTLTTNPEHFWVGGKYTTAGIGPNQVSGILGLGLFLVFVVLMLGPRGVRFRVFFGIIGIWLGSQTIISFSRGGLYAAIGSMLVASLFLARTPRARWFLIFMAIISFAIFRYIIVPVEDVYTGGMVSDRLEETDLTGRGNIMKADVLIFLANPVFGVGPGQSYYAHALTFRPSAAHTEFTRLLSEHGFFGVVALLMLILLIWTKWRGAASSHSKGFSLAFYAWAVLSMSHQAMRLVAQPFLFGLGGANLDLDEDGPIPVKRAPKPAFPKIKLPHGES